jgi:glycosyltransferase involved in cell wall biosynthesis
MSVRKGVELVVALTHRLDDLAGRVEIICIGGHSLFSDYRGLLENLNPRTGSYVGELASSEVPGMYQGAHGVIQPSWYEPFGNTVAEALATGLPVVVSNEVGAGENAPPSVCRTHPIGDLDAMERAVRGLIADLEAGGGTKFAVTARQYAAARFGRDNYADTMLALIEELTGPYADRIRLPAT